MSTENKSGKFDLEEKISTFFSELTKGNYSLAMTYWVYGVLAGFVWSVAILSIVQTLDSEWSQDSIKTLYKFLYVAMTAYFCAVYVGIWKSADKFKGNKVWSVLAKFVVIITAIPIVINVIKISFA
jgi:hypothetical protein